MTLLESLNANDRFASGIGARIVEIREGYARAELTVEERHVNAAGVCQGGVMYTLGDLAFAAVANCHGVLSLGVNNTITFLKSAQLGERLKAECTEVCDHHKLPYCDVRITNQHGELCCVVTGMAYRKAADLPIDGLE